MLSNPAALSRGVHIFSDQHIVFLFTVDMVYLMGREIFFAFETETKCGRIKAFLPCTYWEVKRGH